MKYSLEKDLSHIAEEGKIYWPRLQNARICLSGGTGFFGKWLVDSFCFLNDQFSLNAELHILTRSSEKFLSENTKYKTRKDLKFYDGSVVEPWPMTDLSFTHVLHAAAGGDATPTLEPADAWLVDNICSGTRRALELTAKSGAKRFLYVSSGGVYGKQPLDIDFVEENYNGCPAVTDFGYAALYGEGKRLSEMMSFSFAEKFGFSAVSARCFAFVGPHLAMNKNFAIGNFIRNVVRNEKITILGDGTPLRSYLYAADLALHLWVLLLSGENKNVYNVGSEHGVSIYELAKTVRASLSGAQDIEVKTKANPGVKPDRYMPSCKKMKTQFGLRNEVALDEAIRRTAAWYQDSGIKD